LLNLKHEAAVFYPAFFEYSKQQPFRSRILGITAAAGEKWAESEAHFGAALDLAESLPDRIGQADVRQDWARALLQRGVEGDRERALQMLAEAERRYRQMGMVGHLAATRAMMAAA
jgi:hypothetical protein